MQNQELLLPEDLIPPPPEKPYYPLGLPRGSVRAILALTIFGTTMLILLQGRSVDQGLWVITNLMLGYYFAARQRGMTPKELSKSDETPLKLPRGSVRWIIILSFLATGTYIVWSSIKSGNSIFEHKGFFPMISIGSFFLGRVAYNVIKKLGGVGATKGIRLFSNIKASLALASAIILIVIVLFQFSFVGADHLKDFSVSFGIFYFGSR